MNVLNRVSKANAITIGMFNKSPILTIRHLNHSLPVFQSPFAPPFFAFIPQGSPSRNLHFRSNQKYRNGEFTDNSPDTPFCAQTHQFASCTQCVS